ncbi:(2Fe-2S)-binding protein [Salinivibrio kushneri]|uniref:(2Fe-2S)-binding protein n=1 Tax=Salinivibrio kushneri TaxID=1908198 RepID=UPI00098892BA|nr:(2Fe-2S)-binding protein [Salinivibrio kushneri]OOE35338.1 (2Fe-2S)-binding protein [Salinivibrio kushneri]OOE52687.1 (2Fe-2S)-binding protein [Salinivibrio kushneri]
MRRNQDITDAVGKTFSIHVNGETIPAIAGESVLSTLLASNIRALSKNDYGRLASAYCGMGVCHCCTLEINGRHKQRACQVAVRPDMDIRTETNIVVENTDLESHTVEQGESHV